MEFPEKNNLISSISNLFEDATNYDATLKIVIKAIASKILTILEVVEALKSSLIHEKPYERAEGTNFLSKILESSINDSISSEELTFLLNFYIDRLKDHHSVIPHVLKGFLVMVCHPHMRNEGVVLMLRAIFKEVHCQSQVMTDRRVVFNILKQCILIQKEGVFMMKDEFLLGFISAMEGEKDPRNLVLLFTVVPIITQSFELGTFAEDLFEVVAAYFPIDFIPPSNDPFGISPEDLTIGLRSCLSSTDQFAPFCIPLLVEKLDSDLAPAKLDSLRTLISCCLSYTNESMSPHVLVLWNCLRREIVEGSNPEVETEALATLTSLVENLERGSLTPAVRDSLNKLGSLALSECLSHLARPEQRLVHPSGNILLALSKASPTLTNLICSKVLPLLQEITTITKEPSAHRNTYVYLAKFLEQSAKFNLLEEEPFQRHRELGIHSILQELMADNATSILVACEAIKLSPSVPIVTQKKNLASRIIALVVESSMKEVRSNLIDALIILGHIDETILSVITTKIENSKDREIVESQLKCLSSLTAHSSTDIKNVWSKIWSLFKSSFQMGDPIASLFIDCLVEIANTRRITESMVGTDILSQLINFSFYAISSSHFDDPIPVLQKVSQLSRLLICTDHQSIVESVIGSIINETWDSLEPPLKEALLIIPSNKTSLFVYIFELTLCLKSMETFLLFDQLMTKICHWALCSSDLQVQKSSAVLVAAHLNKLSTDEIVEKYAEKMFNPDASKLTDSSVNLLGWIVKALIMRGHKNELNWILRLEKLLVDEEFGQTAAECYKFMLQDLPHVFNVQTGSRVRMLYVQRFFESRILSLVEQFSTYKGKLKFNNFIAISYLLPQVPLVVLQRHLQRLLPVLAQGLSFEDPIVRRSSVKTLRLMLQKSSSDIISHVSTLLPPLIKLINHSNTMATKIESLSCLQALAELPTTVISPYKFDVINGIKSALDDRKRLVRQAGTDAKCAWVLV